MAKDPWKETADEYGNRPNEDWASNLRKHRDPITGKVLPQNPQGEPRPVGSGDDR